MLQMFFLVRFDFMPTNHPELMFKKRNPKICSYVALPVATHENHPSPRYVVCSYYYLAYCSLSPVFACVSSRGCALTRAAARRHLRSSAAASEAELNWEPAKQTLQATA